jgi:hypothetical protein
MFVIPAFASADFTYDFNHVQTGVTPGGDAPWATLTGTQNGSDVDFVLTFNDNNVSDALKLTEFLKQLDIAYSGDLSGSSIVESEDSITDASIHDFTDASLSFNAETDFDTAHSGDRVNVGESVSFTITNADADLFTGFLLHINGIGEGSSKVNNGVPEPASMAALGIGAMGLLARRRRNKK